MPDCGEIKLDGNVIDDRNRELYRQLFSTVFADFYLFDRFIGLRLADVDAQAKTYLEQLGIAYPTVRPDQREAVDKEMAKEKK